MMNHQRRLTFLVAVLLALVQPRLAPAADVKERLAEQARVVLRKYCLECHGPGKEVKAELRLLDYKLLLERRIVVPSNPEDSELLQLVQCGTMPPGTRPKLQPVELAALRDWIGGGAPDFPPEFGEIYVLRKILEDVRSARDSPDVGQWRYLSFNHLLAGSPPNLDERRTALAAALSRLSRKTEPPRLLPIEPTQTVFRVDLRDLGWDVRPFVEREGSQEGEPSRVNLFDLLLLEYPHAILPERSEEFRTLVVEYLKRAVPVRAIPYVRGDWLTDQAAKSFLAAELSGGRFPKVSPLDTNSAKARSPDEKQPGTPVLPIDGLTYPNRVPPGLPFKVNLTTTDERGREKTVFRPGDQLAIVVANRGERTVYVELVGTGIAGNKKLLQTQPVLTLEPGKEHRLPAEGGMEIMGSLGKDQFTLYASDASFPAGVVLRDKSGKIPDRFVHPFYEVPREGNEVRRGFDPGRFLKQTVEIETRKP
jgi:hypothetical protein